MNRRRKRDEEAWEDDAGTLSADHVVERFFAQHEHDEPELPRRPHPPPRQRRREHRPDAEE